MLCPPLRRTLQDPQHIYPSATKLQYHSPRTHRNPWNLRLIWSQVVSLWLERDCLAKLSLFVTNMYYNFDFKLKNSQKVMSLSVPLKLGWEMFVAVYGVEALAKKMAPRRENGLHQSTFREYDWPNISQFGASISAEWQILLRSERLYIMKCLFGTSINPILA